MAQLHSIARPDSRYATSTAHSLRLVARSDRARPDHGGGSIRPGRPDPHPQLLVSRLAQAIAEVLAGARQPGQLESLLSPEPMQVLRRAWHATASHDSPVLRPSVSSIRMATPTSGAIEACAVVVVGHRSRAIALRLDAIDHRWRCTALRIG